MRLAAAESRGPLSRMTNPATSSANMSARETRREPGAPSATTSSQSVAGGYVCSYPVSGLTGAGCEAVGEGGDEVAEFVRALDDERPVE